MAKSNIDYEYRLRLISNHTLYILMIISKYLYPKKSGIHLFFLMGSYYISQADLKILDSSYAPVSASWDAAIASVCHHGRLISGLL